MMKKTIPFFAALCVTVICLTACSGKAEAGDSITAFSGSFVRQGKPAADLAHYRIAYYEPAASDGAQADLVQGTYLVPDTSAVRENDEPFVMVDYGPRDLLPAEITKPSIYVMFSQPVVPLTRLGEPVRDGADLFTVEPPLAGVYRWYGSKLLAFEPDAESLPQQRYTITVSDRLTSLGGKTLAGARSFEFETERLSVVEWQAGREDRVQPGNVPPADAQYIRLIFSHPVNLDEIAQWIEVRTGDQVWPFTLSRFPATNEKRYQTGQDVLLSINDALPHDTEVVMTLKAGACSEPGWLGTTEDTSWTYHTLLPFSLTGASTHNYTWHSYPGNQIRDSDPFYIRLEFNQEVEPAGAEQHISVAGFPALKKENIHVEGRFVEIGGLPLEDEKPYTVHAAQSLCDLYGRTLKTEARMVVTPAAESYVRIDNQGPRMLEASYPPKIIWEAQKPVSLQFRAGTVQSPYERLPSTGLKNVQAGVKRHFMEDLSPFLNAAGKGIAAFRWDYTTKPSWRAGELERDEEWLTVQVTNIGITVRYAHNMVLVWATHLSDGSPAVKAAVALLEHEDVIVSGVTDAQGLAVFEFSGGDFVSRFTEPQFSYWRNNFGGLRVRVSEGAGKSLDRAEFIPNDSHNLWRFDVWTNIDPFTVEKERQVIFLFTDRGLYRPGETVYFRGIDRSLHLGQYEAYRGQYQIEISSGAYQAPVLMTLNGQTTPNGGLYGSFSLPASLNPGVYSVMYRRTTETDSADDEQERITHTAASFTVAHFQRLRFESSLHFSDPIMYQGETLTASLSAAYLAGGGLAGAPYTWYLTREPASVVPGGESGMWRNWRFGPERDDSRSFVSRGEGGLDSGGKAVISNETVSDGVEGSAYRYRLETAVQDAARQEIASNASVVVHPALFYIAARLDSGTLDNAAAISDPNPSASFISAEKPATVSWTLVSPEGNAMQGQSGGELSIQLVRHEWKQARQAGVGGRVNLVWERVEEIVEQQTVSLAMSSGAYSFTPGRSGLWEIRLQTRDSQQRIAATRFRFYVSGAGWVRWNSDDVDTISLTTGRPSYAPGETAQILVRSPLEKGTYLLTLERESIISQEIIELEGSALTIDIPVKESYMPVMYAALTSYTVRSGPPQNSPHAPDLDKPKGIFGVTPIYVDHSGRHYQVEIETDKTDYRPAEEASVTIKVLLNGKPVPETEVAFMAVDRGVLDLINYHVPDPAAFFYDPRHFPLGVRGADSRSLLIDPVTYALSDLAGGDSEDSEKMEDSGGGSLLNQRADFRATAAFEPNLKTGPDGTVTVQFKLPDSLTTFRCTALAAGLDNFGITEHELQVSAPLTATAVLPRKLRWRDTGTVSLLLTNHEKFPVEASVALAVSSDAVIAVDGEASKTAAILPGDTAEVMFRVAAAGAGEAELAFTLRSPQVNERIVKTIVVDRPGVTETVTIAGNLGTDDSFVEEGVVLPSLIPENSGALAISLSASRLAALKETFAFLRDYPYGCIEQRTARLLPLIILGDLVRAFDGTDPARDEAFIAHEFSEISLSQLPDGSFPYWPGGRYGDFFVSMRVAHIAALAKVNGITIPDSLDTQRLLEFITSVSYRREELHSDPFLKGYSLWIRAMYGERIGSEISGFLKKGDQLGISGWAFAGLAALELGQKDLAASTMDRVRRFFRPGTRTLDLTDTYERQANNYWGYDSDRYALALLLLYALSPDDEHVSRLAESLIQKQRRGVWNNTASSYWALLALGKQADSETAERQTAASVTLGGAGLFNAEFSGAGGVPVSYNGILTGKPFTDLSPDTVLPLRIEKNGPGRLYYTASLRYGVPTELTGARDEGLGVFAETFDSEGKAVADGKLTPGTTYTRRITVSSSRDRAFVALRAPVPSGAEIIDAAFVTSSTVPPPAEEPEEDNDEPPPVHFNTDDEARFHWDFFRAGRRQVEFRFRAVMPGIYPTPPASAECMYEGEVFGRTAGELIRIL